MALDCALAHLQYGDVQHGLLLKRYKRFLADVKLVATAGGDDPTASPEDFTTVHCPNTGPMTGLLDRSAPVHPPGTHCGPSGHGAAIAYFDSDMGAQLFIHSSVRAPNAIWRHTIYTARILVRSGDGRRGQM